MSNNVARNLNCLYNIDRPGGGIERLTDREATAKYGSQVWENSDHIDHSEWCDQHGPRNDGQPPF